MKFPHCAYSDPNLAIQLKVFHYSDTYSIAHCVWIIFCTSFLMGRLHHKTFWIHIYLNTKPVRNTYILSFDSQQNHKIHTIKSIFWNPKFLISKIFILRCEISTFWSYGVTQCTNCIIFLRLVSTKNSVKSISSLKDSNYK